MTDTDIYVENTTIMVSLRNIKRELEEASGHSWSEEFSMDVELHQITSCRLKTKIKDITVILYGSDQYKRFKPTGRWVWSPYLQRATYLNAAPGPSGTSPLEAWNGMQDTLEQWLFREDEINLS